MPRDYEQRLTNKVLLSSAHFQADKSDNTRDNCQSSQRKCECDAIGTLKHASRQQDGWNSIDDKIAGQVESEVENERLRRVEHRARAVFLAPLYRHVGATEERIVEQNCQVTGDDKCGHGVEHLAQSRVGRQVEICPVEGKHTELGEAHTNIVEVVGRERYLERIVSDPELQMDG